MSGWHFKARQPGDTIREHIFGEFFANEAISDPGMALVREGIQNSLDARAEGSLVRVRIAVFDAPRADGTDQFWVGLNEHVKAKNNGLLPDDKVNVAENPGYILFEDFGTSGLEGDPEEPFKAADGGKNNFYHFFRAEGQSDKGDKDRGSWGVGKHVFSRSSRISTVFGLTVRNSDRRRLLMGRCILKAHHVGESYFQDGYFGELSDQHNEFVLPIDDSTAIDTFCERFRLRRKAHEPGLSLVITWPDPEIQWESLLRAVLRDYFYPILSDHLNVIIGEDGEEHHVNSATLDKVLKQLPASDQAEMTKLLDLSRWSGSVQDSERVTLNVPDVDRAWAWSDDLISSGSLRSMQDAFYEDRSIAVRVPVTVRRKDSIPAASYFDVYLVRDPDAKANRPTFIREGVIVSDVKSPMLRGARAIVVAEDGDVASFLRAAENPSHTDWQHDSSNFKGVYKSGRSDLTFVKRAVYEILQAVTAANKEEDREILADIFSLPQEGAPPIPDKKPGKKKGRTPPQSPNPPLPRPRRFRVELVDGGFCIVPGDRKAIPGQIAVRCAYDIRRGNPLNTYAISDFDLDHSPMVISTKGAQVLQKKENRMLVSVTDLDFRVEVRGFDKNRDLYVRALHQEDADGSQEV